MFSLFPQGRRPAADPLARTIRQLERQGGVLVAWLICAPPS
jgi:hypothetical protein